MNYTRRQILKSLSLIGSGSFLTFPAPLFANSHQSSPQNMGVIVPDNQVGASFISGVCQYLKKERFQLLHSDLSTQFVKNYLQILHHPGAKRIVGIADNANAILIIDIARSFNAKVRWEESLTPHTNHDIHQIGATLVSERFQQKDPTPSSPILQQHYVSFLLDHYV